MIIGLETNNWIYEEPDIDILMNNGGRLLTNICQPITYV